MGNVLQTMAVRIQKVRQPLTNKSKNEELMKSSMLYDNSYTLFGNITEDKKEEMISLLENNVAYVE